MPPTRSMSRCSRPSAPAELLCTIRVAYDVVSAPGAEWKGDVTWGT